jgi:hypothetical protein
MRRQHLVPDNDCIDIAMQPGSSANSLRCLTEGTTVKTDLPQRREVGMTLVCPECDLAVVVLDVGDAANATMTCHTIMKRARPVRCWRVYPQPSDAVMVAGALYTDEPSGLTLRCTRPGVGTLRLSGRQLRPATAQPLRRTAV